jgi:hypothetical protein
MFFEIERRIEELCRLAANEHDSTRLKGLVQQLIESIDERQQQRAGTEKRSAAGK